MISSIPHPPTGRRSARALRWPLAAILALWTAGFAGAAALDVFDSQPPDLAGSKISSEVVVDLNLDSEVVNDFSPDADTRVTGFVWWGGTYRTGGSVQEIDQFNVRVYADAGCSPSSLLLEYADVLPVITPAGIDGQGLPVFRYEIPANLAVSGGATYWLSVQASDHTLAPQWGRMQAASVQGCPSLIRSAYFGYLDWTDAQAIAGEPWDAAQEIVTGTQGFVACCLPDGFCIFELPEGCTTLGGDPQGVEAVCDPNPCPQPPQEACCFPDGSCVPLPPTTCADLGGTPQGTGTVCEPNPCEPAVLEACCLVNGLCFAFTVQECQDAEGTPQGPGSVCDPNPCPPAEACCLDEGFCFAVLPDECANLGGEAQGPGSVCQPNPCPQPDAQACCFPDGRCEDLTVFGCTFAGGTSQGTGSLCSADPCPPQPTIACCHEDGTCESLPETECQDAGGTPAGPGTSCDPNVCPVVTRTEETTLGRIKGIYR